MVRRKLAGAGAVRPGFPAETQSLERAARRDGSVGADRKSSELIVLVAAFDHDPLQGSRRRVGVRGRVGTFERSAFGPGVRFARNVRVADVVAVERRGVHVIPAAVPVAAAESVFGAAGVGIGAGLQATLRVAAVSGESVAVVASLARVELSVAADARGAVGVPHPPAGRRSGTANATHHAERFLRATSRSLPRGRPAVKRRAAEGILPRSFPAVVFRTRRGFTRTPHPGPT